MMSVNRIASKFNARYWAIGFVNNGLDGIMNDKPIHVEWLKMPKNGWFADPFILDVSNDLIQVFVEEMLFGDDNSKGVITLLKIDRHSLELKSKKVVLELKTHLSFPCILRENGKIYIYPESACSGKLDIYEYNPITETTTYLKTICDEVVWDSCITDRYGERMLFTAAHNDLILDIYKWNETQSRFLPWKQVLSDNKNSRMGGQLFDYKGEVYYPAQDCTRGYGSAILIKKINFMADTFSFETVKRITSPHPKMKLGLHTMNEYKGVAVVDVYGYRHPFWGRIVDWMVRMKKRLSSD
jgi:hypothetical protein